MAEKTTPVMKQHAAAKSAHPDCVIFFRLGDFYEMFGEDAVLVSELLDLTLTSRNKGKVDEIPMAGVPHHAAHGYIAKLLARGQKVAICEQMADPATVKGIVPRQVVRVITPGTWNPEGQIEGGRNNWLCAVELSSDRVGVAFIDLSTAELMAAEVDDVASLLSEVGRAQPNEVLVSPGEQSQSVLDALAEVVPHAQRRLGEAIDRPGVRRALLGIEWESNSPLAACAAARCLLFARDCLRGQSFPVWRVAQFNSSGVLGLDSATQRHLELVESTVGDAKATLLSILNRTGSPGGARLLRRRLLSPLTDVEQIHRRLDEVQTLVESFPIRTELHKSLTQVGDLERLVVRATLGEVSPRDLGNVRRGLGAAKEVVALLRRLPAEEGQRVFRVDKDVDVAEDVFIGLSAALVERPPAQAKEGAVFLTGFDAELDRLQELRVSGSERMTALEAKLKGETEIANLRVRFNRVFGWFVEVSRSQTSKVPKTWRRKQTIANGERYTLTELDELSEEVQSADERHRTRELELLKELTRSVAEAAQKIHQLTAWLSAVDVANCLAERATALDFCRPQVDDSERLKIVDGRHPVVERLAAAGRFVPNDVDLELHRQHLWLISGPNMAGKSTFLRQVALTVILAQMGSFVPASSAQIGVCDRVLSRVGASDNLAGGESTFMVEMRETAGILKSATSRSFVILDEVGRGTSTFDGLAIARAVAEHLDEVIRCRALFATHYHELTAFAEESPTAANYCVSAREQGDEVVFLHRVVPGAASRSYGIAVAQLAGLPEAVLARARALLTLLEGGREAADPPQGSAPNRQHSRTAAEVSEMTGVVETLRALDPERITALEALQLLHQLSGRLKR